MSYPSKSHGVSGDPVDTFLDRATLQTRIEARRTLRNDGDTTQTFTYDKKGKFYARGMVGQIESVWIYAQNPSDSPKAIDIRFRAYQDRSDEFRHICYVPAYTLPSWIIFAIHRSWNYDRLFVYAETIDPVTGIGYDGSGSFDTWAWDAVNSVWVEESSRLFMRVVMGGQVAEAVPVGVQSPITVEVDKGKYLSVVPSVGFFNGDFEMGDLTGWMSQGCTIATRTVITDTRNLSTATEDGYVDLTWAPP